MATVTTKLTISSSDLVSTPLNLSLLSKIAASKTTGLARSPITSIAKGTASGQVTLYTANQFAATAYMFIKNTDTAATDSIFVYADTSSDDPIILKLAGGDFAVIPLSIGTTFKAYTAISGTVVEWMIFGSDA
jgi:hypothetical protein|tara:strand:+ start:114 stop:512 length:399 start_codon:yes stop_codon:yes gene_type:complete